jgi:hypothetical protein
MREKTSRWLWNIIIIMCVWNFYNTNITVNFEILRNSTEKDVRLETVG